MRTLIIAALVAVGGAGAAAEQREPKLSLDEASKKAKEAAGGGRVERGELEEEGGALRWSFDVRTGTAAVTQVWLDADTGKLVRLETEQASNREAYAKTAQKQLDDLQKRIEELKKEAAGKGEEARKAAQAKADELEKKRAQAEADLRQLETTSAERWRRFKAALDRAMIELRKGYDDALSTGTAKSKP